MLVYSWAFYLHFLTTGQVLEPTDRKQTVADLTAKVKSSGPYQALLVRMGIGPYEPFDEELLKCLVPDCKILVSCSAGYNEFDVPWMTHNGMWFCNTRNAVSEGTADMAMFLILAVLRDTTRGEKQAREGRWRGALSPTRDPTGLTLGILGMGGIGKVSPSRWILCSSELTRSGETSILPGKQLLSI
jgi:lactate dehydrogenase-like 2-hydroxyacid dehydrogenase